MDFYFKASGTPGAKFSNFSRIAHDSESFDETFSLRINMFSHVKEQGHGWHLAGM